MKIFLYILLSTSLAYAAQPLKPTEDSAPPMPKGDASYEYEEYQPNDGTARPGNPGTFTSKGPESNVPETNLEMKNLPQAEMDQEIQAEEAEFDDEVLK